MSILNWEAYRWMGCHKTENGHIFRVWAPNARAVALCGDFSAWADLPMTRGQDGVWNLEVAGAKDGDIYKYAVTGMDGRRVLKADPFAHHAETGPATGSKVWDIEGYRWRDGPWMRQRKKTDWHRQPMNIYELHMGSWRKKADEVYPNYRRIAKELVAYCRQMHFTHVEFMPLTEYPFEGSWGYQVTGYFAPSSRYGTPQDFMYLINALHQARIGVILDWVPAHFPKDEHGLARFDGSPLFEYSDPRLGEHPEWGTLVFDFASPDVRNFLISSALFFLKYYHIDGLRCDAVSSMLYLDYARGPGQWTPNIDGGNINYEARDFLRELNAAVKQNFPGVVTIAEEATAYPGVSREWGLDFTFKWDMGFMHDSLDYFEIDPLYRRHHHDKLTFTMMYVFNEYAILPFSHDEVVHGKRSMVDKMFGDYNQKFATLRALYGYQFGHPGKKHNFMGSEFAQFIEWAYKKELDWFLLDYPAHAAMQRWYAALGEVYLQQPALWEIEDSWEGFTWLNADDADRSSIAFLRRSRSGARPIVCVFNFTPQWWHDYYIGLPAKGKLVPLLSSDESRFGGSGTPFEAAESHCEDFREFHHIAKLRLPPLSAQYYIFEEATP